MSRGDLQQTFSSVRGELRDILILKIKIIFAFSLFALFPNFNYAEACTLPTNGTVSVPLPNPISGSRDRYSPGTIVSASSVKDQSISFFMADCNGADAVWGVVSSSRTPVSGLTYNDGSINYPVFATGVPGIGFALALRSAQTGGGANSAWLPIGSTRTALPFYGASINVYARVTLVWTGPLVAGTYSMPQTLIGSISTTKNGTSLVGDSALIYLGGLTVNIATSSCGLTSAANVSVALPSVLQSSLKAVGDVSTVAAPFSIGVRCDGAVRIAATLTDATNPGNTGNILSLTESSTATGVGLQVFKQGTTNPMPFGPDSSVKGNINQWYVGDIGATGGALTIPLEARYVKTAPTIGVGTVSALSTITFSYQ